MLLQKKLNQCTYYFDAHNSFYLIVGDKKAALIDTGMNPEPYLDEIREITDLPIIVLLTHGHSDHIGRTNDFEEVYLAKEDKELYQEQTTWTGVYAKEIEKVHLFENNPTFDLGKITMTTLHMPGHTKGSVVYVDQTNKQVFTGDAISTGLQLWLQMPICPKIKDFQQSLIQLKEALLKLGVDEHWHFYSGHQHQRYKYPYSPDNPVDMLLIDDAVELCRQLLTGEIVPEKSQSKSFDAPAYEAHYGKMLLVFTLAQLK